MNVADCARRTKTKHHGRALDIIILIQQSKNSILVHRQTIKGIEESTVNLVPRRSRRRRVYLHYQLYILSSFEFRQEGFDSGSIVVCMVPTNPLLYKRIIDGKAGKEGTTKLGSAGVNITGFVVYSE